MSLRSLHEDQSRCKNKPAVQTLVQCYCRSSCKQCRPSGNYFLCVMWDRERMQRNDILNSMSESVTKLEWLHNSVQYAKHNNCESGLKPPFKGSKQGSHTYVQLMLVNLIVAYELDHINSHIQRLKVHSGSVNSNYVLIWLQEARESLFTSTSGCDWKHIWGFPLDRKWCCQLTKHASLVKRGITEGSFCSWLANLTLHCKLLKLPSV